MRAYMPLLVPALLIAVAFTVWQFRPWSIETNTPVFEPGLRSPAIWFTREDENQIRQIYRIDSEGNFETRLTDADFSHHAPHISRDGERAAFFRMEGNRGIYKWGLDEDAQTPVYLTEPFSGNLDGQFFSAAYARPKWPGLLPALVFQATDETGSSRAVYAIRENGAELRRVTNVTANAYDAEPIELEKQTFYVIYGRSNDLWLSRLSGTGEPLQLTDSPNILETLPAVSHQQKLLAYVEDGERIRVVDTTNFRTEWNVLHSIDPPETYSITGIDFVCEDRLVFTAATTGESATNKDLYLLDLNAPAGNNLRRLTNTPAEERSPAVFPCNQTGG